MKLWPLTWTRVRQGFLHRWKTRRAAARAGRVVLRTAPMPVPAESDVEVHMLICHRDVTMGIQSLKSLLRFTPPFAVVVHDDGTLTPEDCALLEHHFPGMRIIGAAEATARVDAELARLGLERCRELRRTYVVAPKVFDCAIYSAGKMMMLVDADVIFLEPPTELLRALACRDPRAPMRFNIDVRPCYSWSDDDIRSVTGFALPAQLNSGLVTMRYDPNTLPELWRLLDRCLALPVIDGLQWVREQTLLAIIGGWHGAVALPPEYDVCARLLRTGRTDLITHHCLSHQRLYFYEAFLSRVAPALRAGASP
jgi:hypothetical protein